MGTSFLILLVFVLMFIIIILIVSLILRIRNLEKRLADFSPSEAYNIMETMRDMVSESVRVADKLDASIKEREGVLEDFSVLVDEKIARLDEVLKIHPEESDKKSMIIDLYKQGLGDGEIARRLGISVAEVRISINLASGKI